MHSGRNPWVHGAAADPILAALMGVLICAAVAIAFVLALTLMGVCLLKSNARCHPT
jgi:hypothetical protein